MQKPNFCQKKVLEMQQNYIREAEKQFKKIPAKPKDENIVNQMKAQQLFENNCRDISRSPPTGTFNN